MASDTQILLTPEQAISVLPEGDSVHVYTNPVPGVNIGADWDRGKLVETINKAVAREIGGSNCRSMKHGLIVWETNTHPLFVEHVESKLAELEDQLTPKEEAVTPHPIS